MRFSVLISDYNFFTDNSFNSTVNISDNNHPWVFCNTRFKTCTNSWSLSNQKRYCLTLHVRTHQCTVGIIMFNKRNHWSCNWNNLNRTYTDKVNFWCRFHNEFRTVSYRNNVIFKCSVFIQFNIRRSTTVVFIGICCHINNFVSYNTVFYNKERRFNKAIIVYSCVSSQWTNQTCVRTFRSFNRTNTSVVRRVNITNRETCSFSLQTTRP